MWIAPDTKTPGQSQIPMPSWSSYEEKFYSLKDLDPKIPMVIWFAFRILVEIVDNNYSTTDEDKPITRQVRKPHVS